jgi:hypothetical protein
VGVEAAVMLISSPDLAVEVEKERFVVRYRQINHWEVLPPYQNIRRFRLLA